MYTSTHVFKGGYLDFSHLTELKIIYISLNFYDQKKKKNKSSLI